MKISELNRWLSDLPKVIKDKDGDTIVDCRLTFYLSSEYESYRWTASYYYCSEYDFHLMCGYGTTLVEAVNHLRRVLKDYLSHSG